ASSAMKPGHRKADSGLMVLPNLLNREFSAQQKNQRWVSDITQIQCVEGWLYVAVVLDLYSRKVVGWASSHISNAELVSKALRQAWQERQAQGSDLLFHSDKGSEYRSEVVLSWLNRRGVPFSMSRRGNSWDNTCMESFFERLKNESTSHKAQITRTAM